MKTPASESASESWRSASPYPLRLRPILFEKVWGGRRLERFGKSLPPGTNIGESWELADMPATSPTGGGGGAARSVIDNGPLAGRTLHDAMELWGRDLLGDARPTEGGDFPLLVKLLDARENLSVQVHPSPAYAAAHPEARLKTECWFVLDAEPGSVIYKGVKPGVTRASFGARIADGSVAGDLVAVPAVPGECHTLPSGTVHALGAGVVVAEVQTPSDTTFRVFDWGRTGRALHVREALECIDFGPAPPATRMEDRTTSPLGPPATRLATNEFFAIEGTTRFGRVADSAACVVLIIVRDGISLRSRTPSPPTVASIGATVVVPAAVASDWNMATGEGTRLLRVTLAPRPRPARPHRA
ncbi:MAG: type I phosphomannose isomerase catalytic subunit [Phycisphaerales bacterium]